jgi:signal transduction histidine kinase
MNIREKVIIYFSIGSIPVIGAAFFLIFAIFNNYREVEFHQQQRERISTTLQFLNEIKGDDEDLQHALDRLTIYDYYDEKLLIFDSRHTLIYSSTEDIPSPDTDKILDKLTEVNPWVTSKDNEYDIVGIYWSNNQHVYYGVSKAYDSIGYSKLNYLRNVLIFSFLFISGLLFLIAWVLASKISHPIRQITGQIDSYDFSIDFHPIKFDESKGEIAMLARQFNLLLNRMADAFAFQKHAIHHISHELKTPIAILVSNFEKMEQEAKVEVLQAFIKTQKQDTKSLADIVNALLEISKTEQESKKECIRIDELLFDTLEELKVLDANFQFKTLLLGHIENENSISVRGNRRLLKIMFVNLIRNCMQYNSETKASIIIQAEKGMITLQFKNRGNTIQDNERQYLFKHFFRGENSKGKRGFGIGLVLANKVAQLHSGVIRYDSPEKEKNIFEVVLPSMQ